MLNNGAPDRFVYAGAKVGDDAIGAAAVVQSSMTTYLGWTT
jgi:hypothetical protein